LQKFCTAVGTGIILSIVGKPFQTSDVGTVIGNGVGIGVGIQGLIPSAMVGIALSFMPSVGKNADPLMTAIMNATATYLALAATLTTIDIPVFIGVGTVQIGSILVVPAQMASSIDSQLQSAGANGKNRTILATAIANGVCTGILSSGTGIVTITGSPTIPIPIPGTGSGIGVIS